MTKTESQKAEMLAESWVDAAIRFRNAEIEVTRNRIAFLNYLGELQMKAALRVPEKQP